MVSIFFAIDVFFYYSFILHLTLKKFKIVENGLIFKSIYSCFIIINVNYNRSQDIKLF